MHRKSRKRNAGKRAVEAKVCPSCLVVKPSDDFYKHSSRTDSLSYLCKVCDGNRVREAYRKNPEVGKQRARDWYIENRERALERDKVWKQRNPDKVYANNSKHRIRKLGTLTEWDLKQSAAWRKTISKMPCYYCGTTDPWLVYHVDHRIPVSKGGDDSWINLVRACESCNLSKSAKTDAEFFGWEETP